MCKQYQQLCNILWHIQDGPKENKYHQGIRIDSVSYLYLNTQNPSLCWLDAMRMLELYWYQFFVIEAIRVSLEISLKVDFFVSRSDDAWLLSSLDEAKYFTKASHSSSCKSNGWQHISIPPLSLYVRCLSSLVRTSSDVSQRYSKWFIAFVQSHV